MGINIAHKDELIAAKMTEDEITKFLEADSVKYLTLEGLKRAVQKNAKYSENVEHGHCVACLTGEYPAPIDF